MRPPVSRPNRSSTSLSEVKWNRLTLSFPLVPSHIRQGALSIEKEVDQCLTITAVHPKIGSKNWRKRENDRCLENGKHISRTSVSWLVASYQQNRSRRPKETGVTRIRAVVDEGVIISNGGKIHQNQQTSWKIHENTYTCTHQHLGNVKLSSVLYLKDFKGLYLIYIWSMFNPNKPWFRVDIPFPDSDLLSSSSSLIGGTCTSRRSTFSKSRPRKKTCVPRMWLTPTWGRLELQKSWYFTVFHEQTWGFTNFCGLNSLRTKCIFFQHKRNTKRNAEKLAFRLLCFLRWFLGFLWMIIPEILDKANPICHISQPTAVLNNQLTLKNIPLLVPSARHVFGALGPSDLVRSHRSPGSCSESRTSEVRFFPKRFLGAANGCRSLNLSEYVGVHVGGVRSSLSWPKKFSPNRLVALPSGVGSLCIRARINSWPRLLQWWNAADRDAWTMFRKRVSRSRPRTRSVSEVISNQYSW